MGILKERLRAKVSELQETGSEIIELGEERLRERDAYLAPLIGELEEFEDEDLSSIQDPKEYDMISLHRTIDSLECLDDDDAEAIQEAVDRANQVTGNADGVKATIEIEPPHELIDYGTGLGGIFEEQVVKFEDIATETENGAEELSEEITKIIQALNEVW